MPGNLRGILIQAWGLWQGTGVTHRSKGTLKQAIFEKVLR
jgi:hypothetical protein